MTICNQLTYARRGIDLCNNTSEQFKGRMNRQPENKNNTPQATHPRRVLWEEYE